MAQSHTGAVRTDAESSRVEIERAAEIIGERLPESVFADTFFSVGHIEVTVPIESARATKSGCLIVTEMDAPIGWEITEVSIHADTESMMVTFTEESR